MLVGPEKSIRSLEQDLQAIVSHHMGSGNEPRFSARASATESVLAPYLKIFNMDYMMEYYYF